MSEELEVLKLVSRRLADAGFPYMVTGSIAGNFYAVPRMTRDIDVVAELSESYGDRLVAIFQDDFYFDRETVLRAVRAKGMFNLIHTAYVMKVDFVVRKDSNYRRRPISVEGYDFFIVAPEDLILSKLDRAKESRSEVQLAAFGISFVV